VIRALVLSIVLLGVSVAGAGAQVEPASGAVLAPVARQAAWLSFEAPRPRVLTHVQAPSYVSDVDVSATGDGLAALYSPLQDRIGSDLMRLNVVSGEMAPFVVRADAGESLSWPVWVGGRVVFQREDLSVPATGYAWQAAARFPSRVEVVQGDGSARTVVVDDGRMPSPSPDGTRLTFVRSSSAGSALLVRGIDQGDEHELLPAGAVIDVASPRFSPSGDVIAFAVATPFAARGLSLLERLLDVRVAEAHGLPWDVWLIGADGSNPHQLAYLGADDPSLAWSPDGRQLFAYGGTGSFLIDVASGETERLAYLVGYGAVAWVR
jgi:hypothetical protein